MIKVNSKKVLNFWQRFLCLILLCGMPASFVFAVSSLQSINTMTLPSNMTRIQLQFSGAIETPTYFSTETPATIVLDFKNADLKLAQAEKELSVGVLTKYQVIKGQEKTRVVFSLLKAVGYTVQASGSNVFVTLSGGAVSDASATTAKISAGQTNAIAQGNDLIKGVDFNRSQNGSGLISTTLASTNTNIDVNDENGLIKVVFANSHLPVNLQRRFDVTNYGTPVQSIDTTNNGNNVVMSIRSRPPYQHMAYQVDNKFIIDVKPSALAQQAATSPRAGYAGNRLSLNFQNISVRAALQLLAQFSGINMVVSDTVIGDMSLRLNNVPWDQALDIILQTRGLGERKVGDTLIIAPSAEIAAREKDDLKSQQQIQALEPLHSELIQINYGKAVEIAQLLRGGNGRTILSEAGSVSVDDRTNTLWVQDNLQKLAEIRKLVRELDIPVRQVLIEARIVNIDKNYERDLGIRWGISKPNPLNLTGTLSGASQVANGTPISEVPFNQRLNVDLPAVGTKTGPPGGLGGPGSVGIALAKLGGGVLLDLELSALQTDGNAKIIASPRLITANQKEALIEAGQEIPYQEATSSGATAVAFKKAVLSLKVTPQITPDNRIILDIRVNQDKRSQFEVLGVPAIDTREVNTEVLVNNGQTVVLGGIFQKETDNSISRIPFLGDLPIVGILFRQTQVQEIQSELLIFITPKIIKQSIYIQ